MDTPDDHEVGGLRWLMARPDLGLIEHHLPPTDSSGRPITDVPLAWAHAIELDDPAPWLRGQGLVLTTGLRMPRTRQGQDEYVARLAAAGASALGFGTGLRFAAIPFGVVAACRAHRLALVEVPLPTPFLAVVQALSDRLGELRRLRISEAMTAQQQLTRAALKGGVPDLARALAKALRGSVVVLDLDGEPLATGVGQGLLPEEVRRETDGRGGRAVHVSEPGRDLEIQPLGASPGTPVGWLAIARETPLTATERLILNHAVSVATLELARPRTGPVTQVLADRAGRLGGAVLDSLLAGRPASLPDLVALHGVDPHRPVVLIALSAPTAIGMQAALDAVARRTPLLVTALDSAAPPPAGASQLLLVAADTADDVLAALAPEVTAAFGPPGALSEVSGTHHAVARALADAVPGDRREVAASPVARLLADPLVADAAGPWLMCLREYDTAQGADLMASLRVFLQHHGAWDPAAKALGIHRHTLRHRIERAEAVAGFDLADAAQRAVLLLGLTHGR